MSFSRIEQDFPAVLKTTEDRALEYGTGCASVAEGRVDFKGEFVPLFKMGTRVRIVRVKDQVETQSFTGEVYLSSEKMLRIVAVRDEVLPGAASAYLYDVEMPGTAEGLVAPPKAPRRLFRFGRQEEEAPTAQVFPVLVHAISMNQVKFTCDLPLDQGQELRLTTQGPVELTALPLRVELPVTFGEGATSSYRCKIAELSGANHTRLEQFLRGLSLRINKSFPPVPD